MLDKLKNFFIKNRCSILFCVIFILFCYLYNIDNQTLNFFLKRGVVLEYSIPENINIDKTKVEEKLIIEKIKYSFIETTKNENSNTYSYEEKAIKNILQIALPIKPTEKRVQIINNISDFVFDSYKNSQLINIKTLNNNYHKPFNSFLNFVNVFFVSLIIWFLILFRISNDKNFFINIKENIFNYIKEKWNSFLWFLKEAKQKGVVYFFKKILLEDSKDGSEQDLTKEIISTVVFVVISVILIRFFLGELRWIPSGSMRLTILERDRVFVEKLNYPTKKEIKRGDILVFYPPDVVLKNDIFSLFARLSGIGCKDIAFIKRVVGMPKDKLEIKYNENIDQYRVYINNKPLNEPYIISRYNWTQCNENMHCGPFVIPENNYFMMGDNRGNSQDSRFWGFLPQDRIIGRANFMFWPISRINILNDKYLELHKEKINNRYIDNKYIVNRYELLYKI